MEITQSAPPGASTVSATDTAHMPALTGIRFFAIFHIFLFHLWVLYDMEKPERFAGLMGGFADLPPLLVNFLSHGWMSTSFFFLLSGFILSYLYWGEDGNLTTSRKRFWLQRMFRIYPVHIIILIPTFLLLVGHYLGDGVGLFKIFGSALLTLTLTQAWVPPAVPLWSWPTWTLSALMFLYLVMPWLMPRLARLTHRQQWILLASLPLISLIPTIIYAAIVPWDTKLDTNWSIFLGSTPIFWLPHFVAGMLLSRLLGITRQNRTFRTNAPTWFAWGDLALLSVIVIACLPGLDEPLKYFLRHGLIMPLYLVLIADLARGRGLAARLFSLPGTGFLGETGFSIFIWQNAVMIACWTSLMINPAAGNYHLIAASIGIVLLGIVSTYKIEKPIAKRLRAKWLKS